MAILGRRGRGRPKMDESLVRSKTTHVRLTEETYESLTKLAARHGRSVSDFARYLIEEGIDRQNEKDGSGYFEDYDDEY